MKYLLTSILCLFIGTNAYATKVGHGGDMIKIKNKYYLLDLVEYGVHETPFFSDIEIDEQALEIVERKFPTQEIKFRELLAKKLTELKSKHLGLYNYLLAVMDFLDFTFVPMALLNIMDHQDTILIYNKKDMFQLAVRQDQTVMIGLDEFLKLNLKNQVALITHELFLAIVQPTTSCTSIPSKETTEINNRFYPSTLNISCNSNQVSRDARKLNGFLYKKYFQTATEDQISSLLIKSKVSSSKYIKSLNSLVSYKDSYIYSKNDFKLTVEFIKYFKGKLKDSTCFKDRRHSNLENCSEIEYKSIELNRSNFAQTCRSLFFDHNFESYQTSDDDIYPPTADFFVTTNLTKIQEFGYKLNATVQIKDYIHKVALVDFNKSESYQDSAPRTEAWSSNVSYTHKTPLTTGQTDYYLDYFLTNPLSKSYVSLYKDKNKMNRPYKPTEIEKCIESLESKYKKIEELFEKLQENNS